MIIVTVRCHDYMTPYSIAVEGSLRLRGGSTQFEGRVEVLIGGEWGTIRDNEWGLPDAMVACRQLGFSTAQAAVLGGYFEPAPSSVPIHLDLVGCEGEEVSLVECEGRGVHRQHSRHHNQDAGVVCASECVGVWVCGCVGGR